MRVPAHHLEIAPATFVLEVVQVAAVAPAVVRRPRVTTDVRHEVPNATALSNPLEDLADAADGHRKAVAPEEDRLAAAGMLLSKVFDIPIECARCLSSDP